MDDGHNQHPLLDEIQHIPATALADTEADADAEAEIEAMGDVSVPQLLQEGTPMIKISNKKQTKAVLRVDPDMGQIIWESKKHKIIPIENIKEIRTGPNARYDREQFQLSSDFESRWLTIIYILPSPMPLIPPSIPLFPKSKPKLMSGGTYKTLNLIAPSHDIFHMWDIALRKLYRVRQTLMTGLGNVEMRQRVWERIYWRGAGAGIDSAAGNGVGPEKNDNNDDGEPQKMAFEEVERLCRRLNINSGREDLKALFNQADTQNHGYLEFKDFQRFVRLLKNRAEINRLYRKIEAQNEGVFGWVAFERFMRRTQRSSLSADELHAIFTRYSSPQSSPQTPIQPLERILTPTSFTAFLLSPDNHAFSDQHRDIQQDMNRPLPEYYISSSHNTYLVGHQLVGESTVEGYIRALLHGCRSVELDIYPGEAEPQIFHGKSLTSKVSLRSVCEVILKYGFIASPYPIIISAEIHCGLAMQEMVAMIMVEVFGERLLKARVEGGDRENRIQVLPSPEMLRGKILLKAKNLDFSTRNTTDNDNAFMPLPSLFSDTATSASSSTSESDILHDCSYSDGATVLGDSRGKKQRSLSDVIMKASDKSTGFLNQFRGVISKPSSSQIQQQTPPSSTMSQTRVLSPPATSSSLPLSLSMSLPSTSQSLPTSATYFSSSPFTSFSPTVTSPTSAATPNTKSKMSPALMSLIIYTVGVKYRGINKKEEYAPEHIFSLSENVANRMLKIGLLDLVKHCRTHLVRVYPKGMRVNSTNFEPHRYWVAGAQLVAINWQTLDLGYMINHAMFQRNGRAGYVLKPAALRLPQKKDLLMKRTSHILDLSIISAQQLPRLKDASGHEIIEKPVVDPYVEVTVYVPEWSQPPIEKGASVPPLPGSVNVNPLTPAYTISRQTGVVKNNGFNPVWEEKMRIPFECVGDMKDLIFVRFVVKQESGDDGEPLAVYCASIGSLEQGE